MIKLCSVAAGFTNKFIAEKVYRSEGIKAAGWQGYIAISQKINHNAYGQPIQSVYFSRSNKNPNMAYIPTSELN